MLNAIQPFTIPTPEPPRFELKCESPLPPIKKENIRHDSKCECGICQWINTSFNLPISSIDNSTSINDIHTVFEQMKEFRKNFDLIKNMIDK